MTESSKPVIGRRGLLAGVAAAAGASAFTVVGQGSAYAARPVAGRGGAAPPSVISASPEPELTGLFDAYSDSGVGWTGADSTYSVELPDGRVVWIFSDTFLGPVNDDGGRPKDAPFLNNSFVIQRGDELTTVHGGTSDEPAALIPPDDDGAWYWAGDGQLGPAGTLDIVYHQFVKTGDGPLDFAWRKDILARFDTDTWKVLDRTELPSAHGITSGAWLFKDGGFTYNYRVEDKGADKHLHIARVRGADLRQKWEFFTGEGWSADEADSARVLTGVANEHSVTKVGGWYLLFTQDTTEQLSARMVAYFATSPAGPFEHRTEVYTTPETGESGSYGNPNVYTYNGHVHPHLSDAGRLVASYNVNSLVPDELYDDISIYRPRFIEVELSGAAAKGAR